jgi:protein-disulfide isomerase
LTRVSSRVSSRHSVRLFAAAFLAILSAPGLGVLAQQHVPAAPPAQQAPDAPGQSAPAQTSSEPSAPAPTAQALPTPNPSDFTAASPTKEQVDAFLRATWGYDDNVIFQVQGILKTPVEGVSKVVVYYADRAGKEKPQGLIFFTLPDGKHIVAGNDVVDFGANPFADVRKQLEDKADGPYRGAPSKDLEIVEFADFQCPHCKEAQANMDKLVTDFPKARVIFQNWPIPSLHPEAVQAAEYGLCVSKQGGSPAFFQFAAAVFDGQDGLATPDGATLTLNSAVTKAGLDPAKIATCAADPQIKAQVQASIKLGTDVGVHQVPTLVVNGREFPANTSYDVLKKVIEFQAKMDGVAGQ